jgi:SAM-dependent methyltransferase
MDQRETTKQKLKKIPFLKTAVISLRALKDKHGIFMKLRLLSGFFADYREYRKIHKNKNFSLKTEDLYPRIFDKTGDTPIDPVYFYQNAWCAKKIFGNKLIHHYDIGSDNRLVSLISQFTPTTMIDIRPLSLRLPGLSFIKGDILNLPFKDSEIASLSSICVIEHIGLGRYGDPLDSFGSEKAAKELVRVLAQGGDLYVSVPVDRDNMTYFNAHRAFTRDYAVSLFSPLKLIEERYIYGDRMYETYDRSIGFGTGLYHFKKQ